MYSSLKFKQYWEEPKFREWLVLASTPEREPGVEARLVCPTRLHTYVCMLHVCVPLCACTIIGCLS